MRKYLNDLLRASGFAPGNKLADLGSEIPYCDYYVRARPFVYTDPILAKNPDKIEYICLIFYDKAFLKKTAGEIAKIPGELCEAVWEEYAAPKNPKKKANLKLGEQQKIGCAPLICAALRSVKAIEEKIK
jgi:hypothetical protein